MRCSAVRAVSVMAGDRYMVVRLLRFLVFTAAYRKMSPPIPSSVPAVIANHIQRVGSVRHVPVAMRGAAISVSAAVLVVRVVIST